MTPLGGAGNNILLLGGHAGGRERERYLFFAATPKVDCLIRLIRRKAKINPKETHARPQEVGNYCGHLPNMAPNGFALGERAAKQFLNLHIGLQNKRE
jgi:hypothetical protein